MPNEAGRIVGTEGEIRVGEEYNKVVVGKGSSKIREGQNGKVMGKGRLGPGRVECSVAA